MEVLRAGNSKEGIGRGKVAGFNGGRLVSLFLEFGGDFDGW